MDSIDTVQKFKSIYREQSDVAKTRGRVTEADTRANIIDRILHEVLEWPRESVRRELYANPGYVDYVLYYSRPVLLIEAKAEGEYFSLPYSKKPRRRLKLSGTLMTDQSIKKAVEQVQTYCADLGVRYGAITNGYSFIIFRAIAEGMSWRTLNAVVFHDFRDVHTNFTEFWNLLSYEAISAGHLEKYFRLSEETTKQYYIPSVHLINFDAPYGRNPINTILRPYIDQFFGDIAAQDAIDVLTRCYVYSSPIQSIDEDWKLIIEDEIPKFASDSLQISFDEEDPSGDIGRHIRNAAEQRCPSPVILLMGGIGSGKSTLCRRFFRVVEPNLVKENGPAMLVYLNFKGAPDDPEQLNAFLWHHLAKSIKEKEPGLLTRANVESMFFQELGIVRSLYSESKVDLHRMISDRLLQYVEDDKRFGEAALTFCAKSRRVPIVVFDNVDQLRMEVQAHVYTAAERFANHLNCLCIVVLREESYFSALMKRHLTAYVTRSYHLSSPRFKELISVRINLALLKANENASRNAESRTVASLFHLLKETLLADNPKIIRLVESIAYGNMRLALLLFNAFLTSGVLTFQKSSINIWKEGVIMSRFTNL